MKSKIHPKWHSDCQVSCACGNSFTTGSTQSSIKVEICSACHPFFTGEMRYVDTLGRVEKFKQKRQQAAKTKYVKKADRKKQKKKAAAKQPRTLKEMIKKEMKKSSKPGKKKSKPDQEKDQKE